METLRDITPDLLLGLGPQGDFAAITARGVVIIAMVSYDPERGRDLHRVLTLDKPCADWRVIHTGSSRGRILPGAGGDAGEGKVSARLACDPLRGTREGQVLARLESPAGQRTLRIDLAKGTVATEEVLGPWPGYPFDLAGAALIDDRCYVLSGGDRPELWSVVTGTEPNWRRCPLPASDESAGRAAGLCARGEFLFVPFDRDGVGCEIWRGSVTSPEDLTWSLVMDRGAGRHLLNDRVLALGAGARGLYVALGSSQPERAARYGPAGFEIVCCDDEGKWEIVVGQPRFSSQGLKVPLSGLGPGLDELNPLELLSFGVVGDDLIVVASSADGLRILRSDDDQAWRALDSGEGVVTSASVRALLNWESGPAIVIEAIDSRGQKRGHVVFCGPGAPRSGSVVGRPGSGPA